MSPRNRARVRECSADVEQVVSRRADRAAIARPAASGEPVGSTPAVRSTSAAPDSPWMTAEQCARYLQYVDDAGAPQLEALRTAVKRYGLPVSTIGGGAQRPRGLRFHRLYVDEWLLARGMRDASDTEARIHTLRARLRHRR